MKRRSSAPWRVVHIITRLERGGAQLATLYQLTHGDFAPSRRTLVHGVGGELDAEAAALAGVEVIPVPALRHALAPAADAEAVAALANVLRGLRRREPGGRLLVHTHSSKAGIVGRLAARLAGAALIVHSVHGFGHAHHGAPWMRPALRLAERAASRVTDGFTADSASNLHRGRLEGLFGRRPARVVRCGVALEDFGAATQAREKTRAALGLAQDAPVVLAVACLKEQKDPLAFVRLAARVRREQPRAHFLWAGDGELRGRLEEEAARLGLGDGFRLLGWRDDVPALMGAADLLALTSRWEGLPQVFPQAMAVGLPIVATRVDGASEAITEGETGLLYAVGDGEGMAAGVLGLLADAPRRARFAATARARATAYSRERMVVDLERFYAGLAAGRG